MAYKVNFKLAEQDEKKRKNNLLDAKNRNEFRVWLEDNHTKESECWAIVKRGRTLGGDTFWYVDAVEEALCFGWIDSTTKKLSNGFMAQKFAPRKKGVCGRNSTKSDAAERKSSEK